MHLAHPPPCAMDPLWGRPVRHMRPHPCSPGCISGVGTKGRMFWLQMYELQACQGERPQRVCEPVGNCHFMLQKGKASSGGPSLANAPFRGWEGTGRPAGLPFQPLLHLASQAIKAGRSPRDQTPSRTAALGSKMSLPSTKRCAPNRACPGTTEPGVPAQAPGKAVTHRLGGDTGKSGGPLQVGEVLPLPSSLEH